jgi:hypothetical protein
MKKSGSHRFVSGKISSKQPITSMMGYDSEGFYKRIEFKGFIFKLEGQEEEIYGDKSWAELKPNDEISALLYLSNPDSLGSNLWFHYAKVHNTNKEYGNKGKTFPTWLVLLTTVLITLNIYGLFFDTADRDLAELFLVKWGGINVGGAISIAIAIASYKEALNYAHVLRSYFPADGGKSFKEKTKTTARSVLHACLLLPPWLSCLLFWNIFTLLFSNW